MATIAPYSARENALYGPIVSRPLSLYPPRNPCERPEVASWLSNQPARPMSDNTACVYSQSLNSLAISLIRLDPSVIQATTYKM
jgi:hypothetical protein